MAVLERPASGLAVGAVLQLGQVALVAEVVGPGCEFDQAAVAVARPVMPATRPPERLEDFALGAVAWPVGLASAGPQAFGQSLGGDAPSATSDLPLREIGRRAGRRT